MPCMRVTGIVRAICAGDRARTTKSRRSGKYDGAEVVDMQYLELVSLSQHVSMSLQ